jgi:hypothetical protein
VSSTGRDVNIGGGGKELSTSIVDAMPSDDGVMGTSTETSLRERVSGITCEDRYERAVFVW